jgi:3-oxoacyl-[acyl-carrier-protein] synthase-1/3-oxoacyl-[acyl-carrier-protein] synthase II
MASCPVAITGLGCVCAAGSSLPECMGALFRGERHPAPPRLFSTTHAIPYPVFEVNAALEHEPGATRTCQLALAATREALSDAGLEPGSLRACRAGVCIGTTVGAALNNEEFYRQYRLGENPSLAPIRRFLAANPALALAQHLHLSGPWQTVVNACSSGTDAIGLAASWIRAGLCDVALAGGADELCRVTYNGFISLLITDENPVRPFDRHRKGLNLGEGAAVLILESEGFRRARGAAARSFVLGYGASCDAYHLTAPHPEGRGLKRAITEALAENRQNPAEVAFANAHGTGTPDNDRIESRVLAEILPGVPFLSTKGYTGHTLGAAGAIEAAFTAACLEAGRIPASAGFATPDPELPAVPVTEATNVEGRVAISQSLAFGGSNAVLVLGKGEARP